MSVRRNPARKIRKKADRKVSTKAVEKVRKRTVEKVSKKAVQEVSNKKVHQCDYPGCLKSYPYLSSLRVHKKVIHEGQRFDCERVGCDKSYRSADVLRRHVQKDHEGDRVPCLHDGCDKSFTSKAGMMIHYRALHEGELFRCGYDGCDFTTKYKTSLSKHVQAVHKGKRYHCKHNGCGFVTKYEGNLRAHVKAVHKGTRFDCKHDGCEYSTKRQSTLITHIHQVHEGKRYHCKRDGCDFSTKYQSDLPKHVRAVHEGRRYDCEYDGCNKSFRQLKSLKTHYRANHENQRFPCPEPGCGATFREQKQVSEHIQRVHLEVRYQCPEPGCDKSFATKSSLNLHLNPDQRQCEVCEEKFLSWGHLLRHMFDHHNRQDLLLFPPKAGTDVSLLSTGTSLSQEEAEAYTKQQESHSDSTPRDGPGTTVSTNGLTIQEQNLLKGRHWHHWLDHSATGSLCIGPCTTETLRWKSIQSSESGQPCPLGMKISQDTAVMVAALRTKVGKGNPGNVYLVLQLPQRCLHCEVVRESGDQNPLPHNMKGRICQFPNCNEPRWQNVGVFCIRHYGIWGFLSKTGYAGSRLVIDVPRSFTEKVPQFLQILATKNFRRKIDDKLAAILPVLLDARPDGPNVYALDTEFRPLPSGQSEVTEAAFVDVKTGRIVVHAVLEHKRTETAATKLSGFLRTQQQDPSAPQHVPMVYNAAGMAKQIEACRFKENDLFVEYSIWSHLLDLSNVRSALKRQKGYDDSLLIPSNHGYAILVSIGKLLSQALPLPSRTLQFVFRLLFPQDPLVDCNHSAAIDALQLARILRLAAEMTKEARERKLPPDLFQGLNELPPANRKPVQSNTLDRYLTNATSGSTPEAEGVGVSLAQPWDLGDLDDLQDMEEGRWDRLWWEEEMANDSEDGLEGDEWGEGLSSSEAVSTG